MTENIVYSCRESISWVKDTTQVVLIDEENRKTFILKDAEAALWGWLSLGYSYKKLMPLLSALIVQSPAEAEVWLRLTLEKWHKQGILDSEGGSS